MKAIGARRRDKKNKPLSAQNPLDGSGVTGSEGPTVRWEKR